MDAAGDGPMRPALGGRHHHLATHAGIGVAGHRADEGDPAAGIVTSPVRSRGLGRDLGAIGEGQVVEHPAVVDEGDRVGARRGDVHHRRLEAQVEGGDRELADRSLGGRGRAPPESRSTAHPGRVRP